MVKNIIIINDFAFVNGGAGKVALTSAKALSKAGYNVILFSAMGPVDKSLSEDGIHVVCLNQKDILSNPNRLQAIRQGIWNETALKALDGILEKLDPKETIVHFHAWIKALSPSVWKVMSHRRFKSVITLHDYFLFCPNGGLFNYKTSKICHKRPNSFRCFLCNCDSRSFPQKIWRDIRQFVQWYWFGKCKGVSFIYISQLNKNVSYPYLKTVSCDWHFLQNPIDLNRKSPVAIEKNDFYLFVGRLSEEKGIKLFCQAMTDLNLKGLVLGDGYLREEYQRKYPDIQFAGWVTGNEKDKLLRRGKALIFPSQWYEGAPLTIIEMKSYGLPCIVPDLCAAAEEIEDGKTGYIFKSGSLSSLKENIVKYEKTDITSFQKNILNSFDFDRYSLSTHCKKLIEIYNSVNK